VKRARGGHTNDDKLVQLLQEWLRIIKKMEFYHIESKNKEFFYAEDGLLHLY
jgi:hypothetical protein